MIQLLLLTKLWVSKMTTKKTGRRSVHALKRTCVIGGARRLNESDDEGDLRDGPCRRLFLSRGYRVPQGRIVPPLSGVALHDRTTVVYYGITHGGHTGLVFFCRPPRFTNCSSTAHHPALPVSTTGISAQVSVAVSIGDCCCCGERHVPATGHQLPRRSS